MLMTKTTKKIKKNSEGLTKSTAQGKISIL